MTTTATLLNVPRDQPDWDRWSFDLSQNIADITQALRQQKGVIITSQQIYPVSSDTSQWLERVSGVIDDICGALGINAADVESVDLQDERERQAWVYTIYQELNAARQMLKI